MKAFAVLFLSLTWATTSSAGYLFGLAFDSSTNMFMRPDGPSGTITSLYSSIAHSSGGANLSYSVDGGMVESYEGIQYHRHTFNLSYRLAGQKNLLWETAVEGTIARFGEVSFLDGYEKYGLSTRIKSYVTPTTLFRCEGRVRRNTFPHFETENNNQADIFLRLDRFFETGTTLRGQIDAGVRRYTELSSSGTTTLYGARIRIAQSLGGRWGISIEGFDRIVNMPSLNETAQVLDRMFLDDAYKNSSYGLTLQTKYLFETPGSIQARSYLSKRTYGSVQTASYWYLPPEGWDETERGVLVTVAYRPGFLPESVHPRCDVFWIDVDASVSDLSYESTGISLRFELF